MEHSTGYYLLKSQKAEGIQHKNYVLKAKSWEYPAQNCVFWHEDGGCLKSVSRENLKLAQINVKSYTWVLSKLAANAILKD